MSNQVHEGVTEQVDESEGVMNKINKWAKWVSGSIREAVIECINQRINEWITPSLQQESESEVREAHYDQYLCLSQGPALHVEFLQQQGAILPGDGDLGGAIQTQHMVPETSPTAQPKHIIT